MNINEEEGKQLVIDLSLGLVRKKLVARTYGNVSVCINNNRMAISPSGMAYDGLTTEDIPIYLINEATYIGKRKPSSEYKIHVSACKAGAEVSIHTHQDYATAVSLVFDEGMIKLRSDRMDEPIADSLYVTKEEEAVLKGIAVAGYGLPGSDDLAENVDKSIRLGARTILMKHHGCMFIGNSPEDAMNMADIMEKVCLRYVTTIINSTSDAESIKDDILTKGFDTQLDDMAQMIGDRLNSIDEQDSVEYFTKSDVAHIRGQGIVVKNLNSSDTEAVISLVKKALLCKQLTTILNKDADLPKDDCDFMRRNYIDNYSKQIKYK